MTEAQQVLARARTALLDGRPHDCAGEVTALEALCADGLSPADAALCAPLLEELRALAMACFEGAASARLALAEALDAAGHLTTYSADGARRRDGGRRQPGAAY